MTLIAHIGVAFLFLFIALPIGSAATATGSKSCLKEEFWSSPNGCCLPLGGPTGTPPSPPKGSACPPNTHYWGKNQGCCVPRFPPPEDGPSPQCPGQWEWNKSVRRCELAPTPSQPYNPVPSDSHGHSQGRNNRRRSTQLKARSAPLCPTGLDACPIAGAKGGDYECLDTYVELQSCGGCASLGTGQDCTLIPGAWNMGCEQGSCTVYSCAGGYKRSPDGKQCIPL